MAINNIMSAKRILFLAIVTLLVASCGSKKKVVTRKSKPKREVVVKTKPKTTTVKKDKPVSVNSPKINSTEEYILHFKDIAIAEMRSSKIPASITLAQGILESGSGKGRLAVKANNHFGIKCHGWKGGKIYHDDDEKQECFRKYKDANQSFKDHSDFLVNRKRYAKLFQLDISDYKSWAKELRKAGYATDRKYPEKLISLIERYQLYKYDEVVIGKKKEKKKSTAEEHIVVKGDTLYSISRKYEVSVDELKRLNSLEDNTISIGQKIVIKK